MQQSLHESLARPLDWSLPLASWHRLPCPSSYAYHRSSRSLWLFRKDPCRPHTRTSLRPLPRPRGHPPRGALCNAQTPESYGEQSCPIWSTARTALLILRLVFRVLRKVTETVVTILFGVLFNPCLPVLRPLAIPRVPTVPCPCNPIVSPFMNPKYRQSKTSLANIMSTVETVTLTFIGLRRLKPLTPGPSLTARPPASGAIHPLLSLFPILYAVALLFMCVHDRLVRSTFVGIIILLSNPPLELHKLT